VLGGSALGISRWICRIRQVFGIYVVLQQWVQIMLIAGACVISKPVRLSTVQWHFCYCAAFSSLLHAHSKFRTDMRVGPASGRTLFPRSWQTGTTFFFLPNPNILICQSGVCFFIVTEARACHIAARIPRISGFDLPVHSWAVKLNAFRSRDRYGVG